MAFRGFCFFLVIFESLSMFTVIHKQSICFVNLEMWLSEWSHSREIIHVSQFQKRMLEKKSKIYTFSKKSLCGFCCSIAISTFFCLEFTTFLLLTVSWLWTLSYYYSHLLCLQRNHSHYSDPNVNNWPVTGW